METKIKEKGLQIAAVLSMGNSLYSILLAVIIGSSAVLFRQDELFLKFEEISKSELTVRFIGLGIVAILAVYYIIDWHDLNQAPYFDEKTGRTEMTLWIISIFIISLSCVLAMAGQIYIVSLLMGIYLPFAIFSRNKLLKPGITNQKTPKEGYKKAFFDISIWGGLVLLSLFWIWLVNMISNLDFTWKNILIASITALSWLLALVLKIVRSITYVSKEYKKAIQSMLLQYQQAITSIQKQT